MSEYEKAYRWGLVLGEDDPLDAFPGAAEVTRNRITLDPDGSIDEIVTDAGMHLEHLGGKRWFLSGLRADGSSIAVWITGRIEDWEEQEAPKCGSCEENIPANAPTDGWFLMCPKCGWSARPDGFEEPR